ncbi:Phosphatidylinositol-glycan biosynthesis class S protein [Corchorus capsularis]|uniref:Phosphatidylinositol-glycan biosynthesis class S protein n=1 Tax=Corchorus capsularis TaxID=210143 RepID=A0A1R3IWB5_COCAP|nr:Phosphatidylinositol-glycan biosynthesis class S protein [Corchorus capsularis]
MPEITQLPESDVSKPLPDLDPKTMRKTQPGLKRLFLTFSVLFSFLLGFPFFWNSVEIYRSPLPFREIDSLSTHLRSDTLRFPLHFHALFIGFHSDPDRLRLSLLPQITKLTSQNPKCSYNFTLSVIVDSASACLRSPNTSPPSSLYQCGSITPALFDPKDDEAVDQKLESVFGAKKEYTVVVVKGENERAVVGKYRHAWMLVSAGDQVEMAAVKVAEVLVKVFVNGGREEGSIRNEFMPVGPDGRIVLSFNLLNADPRDWVFDWDFQKIDETLLAPMIEALNPVANITVESQVLYHTPKASFSHWNQKLGSHVFSTNDLPFFVNSNEWHLDTSIAAGGRSKILQFVVYVPSAKECPLLLQLPNGEISKTNGFISPMWGGVIVWNPQSCLKDSESNPVDRRMIPLQDLEEMFEVFIGQFRQLFGFKSINVYTGASGVWNLLPSERGFTEWELDVLSRQHTCFNLHSCATTLGSLSRLVQSLPRMIIKDEIGKQVKFSLEAARLAQSNASNGVYESSAASSRQARSLAEDAFFHPSIMSVSYYSFEHCFAVYSPFFLPVAMHVVLAALRELRRYKKEKAKYLAWKAKAN